jgi:endogenous inhibitor of DNA gyrase (YacG/DUF329 family)
MKKETTHLVCPLCGTQAVIFENEVSSVDCPNCGKYTYHLSVYPWLNETEFRNQKVLEILSTMTEATSKLGNVLNIDLEMYQKVEKLFSEGYPT